jgi:hypothetical protein
MRRFFSAFLFLSLATLHAAPLERDLGRGLVYFRAKVLPADLPATVPPQRRSCILDLRYATGGEGAASALDAWLKLHASERKPVLVLANTATGAALLAPLASRRPSAGVLLLGVAGRGFQPDIALKITPENERRAYDALEAGATIESLLTENSDKLRNDEARLAKEYAAGTAAPAYERPDEPPADKPAAATAPAPIPIDLVLQRAVHLHRALLALKKI